MTCFYEPFDYFDFSPVMKIFFIYTDFVDGDIFRELVLCKNRVLELRSARQFSGRGFGHIVSRWPDAH